MNKILCSLIIPTYKRVNLLSQCLQSILKQDFEKRDYEVLIIDNAGEGDVKTLVDQLSEKYKEPSLRYIHESRKGLVYARHRGLKEAQSGILIFLDDDGLYDEACISSILSMYDRHPEVAAVGGKILIKWDQSPPDWVKSFQGVLGELIYGGEDILSKTLYINGGLFSIKKTILIEVNGFNPDQVGEYLIGDGESGLCKKLHQKGYLIGWTPQAVMYHQQVATKNGTLKDLARRYYNNGISESYSINKTIAFKKVSLQRILPLFKELITLFFKTSYSKISGNITIYRLNYFRTNYAWGKINFYIHWLNPKYREKCRNENWF